MTSSIRNIRRILITTAIAGFVSGCQIIAPDSDAGQVVQMMRVVLSPPPKVTLEQAAAIPYATIGIQVDSGTQALLVLAADNAGQQLWTSASRVSVVTTNGRITKTAGLPFNLGGTYSPPLQHAAQRAGIERLADFPDMGLYGVDIVCEEQTIGAETITLLGKPIHTERSEERCQSEKAKISWHFTNQFWRDPDSGFVWRSEQYIHPMLGMIALETLRPPEQ